MVRKYSLLGAYIEIQVADNEEQKLFWGRLSPQRDNTVQSATNDAVLYLKDKFNFEVQ